MIFLTSNSAFQEIKGRSHVQGERWWRRRKWGSRSGKRAGRGRNSDIWRIHFQVRREINRKQRSSFSYVLENTLTPTTSTTAREDLISLYFIHKLIFVKVSSCSDHTLWPEGGCPVGPKSWLGGILPLGYIYGSYRKQISNISFHSPVIWLTSRQTESSHKVAEATK